MLAAIINDDGLAGLQTVDRLGDLVLRLRSSGSEILQAGLAYGEDRNLFALPLLTSSPA